MKCSDCTKTSCKKQVEKEKITVLFCSAYNAKTALRDAQNHSYQIAKTLQKRPQNCGTGYCSCIECMMK